MSVSTGASIARFDSLVHVTRNGTWINGRDDASLDRLLRELDAANITRACLVGIPGVSDNDTVLHAAVRSAGRLVPIAGVNPIALESAESREESMRDLRASGFRGIKLHPRLNEYDPLHPSVMQTINTAAAQGLVVFIDTLFRQRGRATRSAPDVIDLLVRECPAATIILLHGGGSELLRVAEIVRLHSNLVLDVSFTLLAYQHTSVGLDLRWVFERLDQRVVIGSDMPEFTPVEAFAAAEHTAVGLHGDKWANIAGGNLARLFPAAGAP